MKQLNLTGHEVGGMTIQTRIISNDFKTQPFDYTFLIVHTQDFFLKTNFKLFFLIILLVW